MKNKNPKIFVLSEHVHAEENSTGYFWSKLIDRLFLKLGAINVITPDSTENKKLYSNQSSIRYLFVNKKKFNKNKILERISGQATYALSFLLKLGSNVSKDDLVLTGTNPALLLMTIPIAKVFWRFKWVVLVHDLFPDNLLPAGLLKKTFPIYYFLNFYFTWVYRKSDLIVVIGRDMEKIMAKKIEGNHRIRYIPNWVDGDDIRPARREDSEILKDLKWQDKLVFQFFGNIGRVQGIGNILQAIKLVKSDKAAFIFIGGGAKASDLQKFISENSECSICYLGDMDQSKKNQGLAACDVALVSLEQGMLGLGVPSKAYFSMAADRPLLAIMDKGSEIRMMVEEHKIGWSCDPNDPQGLATLIDEICNDFYSSWIGSSRKAFEDHFSEKIGAEKFVEEIISLL